MSTDNKSPIKGTPEVPKKSIHPEIKKEAPELSEEELKKVAGGNLGAPIFKKKP